MRRNDSKFFRIERIIIAASIFILWASTCGVFIYSHLKWDKLLQQNNVLQLSVANLNESANLLHIRVEEEIFEHSVQIEKDIETIYSGFVVSIKNMQNVLKDNPDKQKIEPLLLSLKKSMIHLVKHGSARVLSKDSNDAAIEGFHTVFSKQKELVDHLKVILQKQNKSAIHEQSVLHFILVGLLSLLFILTLFIFSLAGRKTKSLLRQKQHLVDILEATPDFVGMADPNGKTFYANPAGRKMMGFAADEDITGMPIAHYHPRKDAEKIAKEGIPAIIKQGVWKNETNFLSRDGEIILTSQILICHKDGDGNPVRFSTIARDIRKEKQAENKLRIAATVFDAASESVVVTDSKNRIVDVNPAFTFITGYSKPEVIGRDPNILSSGKQGKAFYKKLWAELQTNGCWQGELINKRKNGELYHEWLSLVAIKGRNNEITRHIAIFSDITKRKQAEEIIKRQATYDVLTGLPNRRLFNDRFKVALSMAVRDKTKFGLMFMDIDYFKLINDRLGHSCGDELLQQVAVRLHSCLRDADTVARIGGDEFAVLIQAGKITKAGLEKVAKNIIDEVSRPFSLGGKTVKVTLSVGIAIYPKDASSMEDLMKAADMAMYNVKESGRNGYKFS